MVEVRSLDDYVMVNNSNPLADPSIEVVPEMESNIGFENLPDVGLIASTEGLQTLETAMQSLGLGITTNLNVNGDEDVSSPLSPSKEFTSPNSVSLSSEDKDRILAHLLEENKSYKEIIHQNNLRMKQQVLMLRMGMSNCDEVFQKQKEHFQGTKSLILKLQSEKDELHRKCQHLEDKVIKMEQETSGFNDQNSLQAELEACQFQYELIVKKNDSLLAELNTYKEENIKLAQEIKDLKALDSQARDVKEKSFLQVYELSAQLADAERKLSLQSTEITRLLTMLEDSKHNQNLIEKDASIERLRNRIDEMTAIIVDKVDKIESLTAELNAAKEEILRLNEEIPVLKAQTSVYESDFMLERGERERLSGELYQLKNDFKELHRQLQLPHPGASDADAAGNANVRDSPVPQQRKFYCPKCLKCFQGIAPLELHVELCMQLQ